MLSIHDIEAQHVYEGVSGARKKVLAIRNRGSKVSGSSVVVFEVLESNPTKRKHHNALSVGTIHTVYIGNFVKSTVLDVTEECMADMTTGRITQLTTSHLHVGNMSAGRIENGTPKGYRLCKKTSGELVLQGYFTWTEDLLSGGDWRDLPTVQEKESE